MQIELIYVKFVEHNILSGLEISFSHHDFVLNENVLKMSETLERSIFKDPIMNLTAIVGKNGSGKSSIMNSIFQVLQGNVQGKIIIGYKIDDVIHIFHNIECIKSEESKLMKVHSLNEWNNFFERRGVSKPYTVSFISDFLDKSVTSYNNNNDSMISALNYTPKYLIQNPERHLDSSNAYKMERLNPTVANFELINDINQIATMLKNDKIPQILNLKLPNEVRVYYGGIIPEFRRSENISNDLGARGAEFWGRENVDLPYDSSGDIDVLRAITDENIPDFETTYESIIHEILKEADDNELLSILKLNLVFALLNVVGIENYGSYVDYDKARRLGTKNSEDDIDALISELYSVIYSDTIVLIEEFIYGLIKLDKLEKSIVKLIEHYKIEEYFSKDKTNLGFTNSIHLIIRSYKSAISIIEKKDMGSEKYIKFKLGEASKFLKDYLYLRDGTRKKSLMLSNVQYYLHDTEFYFSSGQEKMIRLNSYIEETINYAKSMSGKDKNSILFLIDEADCGLHPEMQLEIINYLVESLSRHDDCNFQVILTTHSPIITSDLTSNHIAFLQMEKIENKTKVTSVKKQDKPKTFAQNIYNLYKYSFCVQEAVVGKYAESIIMQLVSKFKSESTKSMLPINCNIDFVIEEIGEPLIKEHIKGLQSDYMVHDVGAFLRDNGIEGELLEEVLLTIKNNKGGK